MITNPTIYVNAFGLEPIETVILNGIISIRLRGNKCQPGWREMAVWIHRSTRSVARAVATLEERGLLKHRRRGKRLTNIYWIAYSLWRRLIAGRRARKEPVVKETNEPINAERAKAFYAGLLQSLGPPGGRRQAAA